jgi:hypothetical protein
MDKKKLFLAGSVVLGVVIGLGVSQLLINPPFKFHADEAGSQDISPVLAMENPFANFPGTEDLGPDEMRIISLGTAMPFQRSSCIMGRWHN